MTKHHLFAASALSASLLLTGGAYAQAADTPIATAKSSAPPAEPAKPKAASEKVSEANEVKEIVVTGSRLRSEFTSATPLQIVTVERMAASGLLDTAEMIARMPAASATVQVNNRLSATGAGGAVVTGGTNANTIGLRGLGADRTLTLMNGRRLTPSGVGSQVGPVDLNVLPSSIIDRVEILTDGASSIYGSDAIAGVVNVITRRTSKGLELNAFTRMPQAGGGEFSTVSLFWGKAFDRGFLNIAAEYNEQRPLKMKDRPETACRQDFVYDPNTGDRIDLKDQNGNFKCRNHNPNGIFYTSWFSGSFQYDPGLTQATYPAAALNLRGALPDWVRTNRAGYPDTFSYARSTSTAYDNADSIAPNARASLYVSGAYTLSDNVEAYGDALYTHRGSASHSWYFLFPNLSASNPNNTVSAGLLAASNNSFDGSVNPQLVRPFLSKQDVDYVQLTGGLRGKVAAGLLKDWDWDVSARYGYSHGKYGQTFIYNDRVQAATAPGVACDASKITISGPTTCVSIPWLTPRFLVDQNWTDAETNFLEGWEEGLTTYKEASLDGSIAGSLFQLPAGDVQAAVGFVLRRAELDDTPGPNAQAHNYFAFSTAGRTAGKDTVKEAFGEINAPLIADIPLIKRLSLTASGRYTDYSSYGSGSTYKVGAHWIVVPSLALRVSRGTSFRAPSLYELYLANQTSFFNYIDPCMRWGESTNATVQANCRTSGFAPDFAPNGVTSIIATAGGGAGLLKAETSKNLNVGATYRPSFADFQLAVDYYDIQVKNEVASYGVANIVNGCYGRTDFPNTFCSLITRDPATRIITAVDNRLINLAEQNNRGVDVSVRYAFTTPFGRLSLSTQASRTLENTIRRDANSFEDRLGFSGNPKLTGFAEANLRREAWSFTYGADYIGETDDSRFYDNGDLISYYGAYSGRGTYGNNNNPTLVRSRLKVKPWVSQYASARWQIDPSAYVLLGVSNLFDKAPPVISADAWNYRVGSVPTNLYNLTGRTFFLRAGKTF